MVSLSLFGLSSASTRDIVRLEIGLVQKDIERRWDEIDYRIRREARLTPWHYILVGAVLSFPLTVDPRSSVALAEQFPFILSVLATLLLWFPVTSAILWNDVRDCEAYLRQSAYPRQAELLSILRSHLPPRDRRRMPALDPEWSVHTWKSHWNRDTVGGRNGRLPVLLWRIRDVAPHLPPVLLAVASATLVAQGTTNQVTFWITVASLGVYVTTHLATLVVELRVRRSLHSLSAPRLR